MNEFMKGGFQMSSLGRVSKDLLKERFKIVTWIFAIQIIIILANQFIDVVIKNDSQPSSFTGNILMGMFAIIVILTIMNERILTNDRYRLIPISDSTLYSSIMGTAIVSLLYSVVGEIVIYLAAYKVFPNVYDQVMISDFNSVQQYLFKFEVLVAFILGVIVLWTGIMALNLLINWVNDFLPFRNQTFMRVIIAIVLIWVMMIPFNFITVNALRIMGLNNIGTDFAAANRVMYTGLIVMVLWIVVFSAINIYLLNKKSESTT